MLQRAGNSSRDIVTRVIIPQSTTETLEVLVERMPGSVVWCDALNMASLYKILLRLKTDGRELDKAGAGSCGIKQCSGDSHSK